MGEAWIIDAVRTPRGKGKKETGALSGIHPQELLAQRGVGCADRCWLACARCASRMRGKGHETS
jgi:acetyl-CoA C-acetyltransferase